MEWRGRLAPGGEGRKGLRRILCRPRHPAPVAADHAPSLVALSAGDVGGRGSTLSMDRDESVSFWRRTGRGLLRLTRSKGGRKSTRLNSSHSQISYYLPFFFR